MERCPRGFIADVALCIRWHLCGGQKTCLAFWNYGSGFWCVAHGHHSLMVDTGEFKTVCQPLPPKLTKLYPLTRVMPLIGNHMPYAPLGIINITLIAGNDVDMDMKNTLPGRSPDINADVVAVGLKLLVQQPAFLGNQCHTGVDLFGHQIEKAGDMSARDDQRMTRAHRVAIARAERKCVTQRHPAHILTKQARVIGIAFFFGLFFGGQTSTPWSVRGCQSVKR